MVIFHRFLYVYQRVSWFQSVPNGNPVPPGIDKLPPEASPTSPSWPAWASLMVARCHNDCEAHVWNTGACTCPAARCHSDPSARSIVRIWRICWRPWTPVTCTTSVAWSNQADFLFRFVFRHILSTFPGCFKPNECQKPAIFHETLVMDQLVQLLGELILDTDSTDTFTIHLEPNESSNWHQAVASKCHHNQPPTSQVWNNRTGEDHARWLSKQMSLQRDCEALPPLELTHQQILIAHLDAWKPMVVWFNNIRTYNMMLDIYIWQHTHTYIIY